MSTPTTEQDPLEQKLSQLMARYGLNMDTFESPQLVSENAMMLAEMMELIQLDRIEQRMDEAASVVARTVTTMASGERQSVNERIAQLESQKNQLRAKSDYDKTRSYYDAVEYGKLHSENQLTKGEQE